MTSDAPVPASDQAPSLRHCEQLGLELREYREHAGLDAAEVAEHLSWPQTRLDATEEGTRRVTASDLKALLSLYEVTGTEAKRLRALRVRASKEPPAATVPARYQQFHELQSAAIEQRTYAPTLLPPILQTDDYATAVNEHGSRPDQQTTADLAKYHVQQSTWLLNREQPFELHVVLGEAALYNVAGSSRTMIRQLDQLAKLVKLPHIHLQILPFAECGHATAESSFTLLTGDQSHPWLSTDDLLTTTCTNVPSAVITHQGAFATLTTRALNRDDSLDRLHAIRRSHATASQRRPDVNTEVCRRLRTKFNLTIDELAAAFDCSTETIGRHLTTYKPTDTLAEPIPYSMP
ncbi:Scr1 family TA system antitoxin-like transcriptional regulator [Amycolatopsis sp. 195334CR]|uniref:helix-turn-helix domain-containing protein n=1 Tax=Amycolatopsis sp. 195334CR TaxID=2814588 RepID=UPI001A8F7478|nr:Scr1 family TA system antitoxin-like transcriptional regulator [Amycolatopsis sp. 195334CR]MBN6040347.1 helix-turn-helix domain-containing protein [Amycolatopsis sp. 195334CR]